MPTSSLKDLVLLSITSRSCSPLRSSGFLAVCWAHPGGNLWRNGRGPWGGGSCFDRNLKASLFFMVELVLIWSGFGRRNQRYLSCTWSCCVCCVKDWNWKFFWTGTPSRGWTPWRIPSSKLSSFHPPSSWILLKEEGVNFSCFSPCFDLTFLKNPAYSDSMLRNYVEEKAVWNSTEILKVDWSWAEK